MSPDGSAVLSVDRCAGEVWLCCGLQLWRTKNMEYVEGVMYDVETRSGPT